MCKNIPQTKTCKKCGEKKDRSEFINIRVCTACTDKELEAWKTKRKQATLRAKADMKEFKKLEARKAMQSRLAFEAWTALRTKDAGECPYKMTCGNKDCLPDQREWCRKQEAFMYEPDAKRREVLIWDFIMSFQDLIKKLIKTRVTYKKWLRQLGVDDIACQMNMVLARRFVKMMDEGTYGKKKNLKGYLNICIYGESIRLLKVNGMFDYTLDGLTENGFHGLGKKWVA